MAKDDKSAVVKLEVIGVYDPYLHYSVFHGIVGVLSEKASKVFAMSQASAMSCSSARWSAVAAARPTPSASSR